MDMVRHPPDLQEDAALSPDDAAHIVVEAVPVLRGDERNSLLRAENDVDDQAHIAVRHSHIPPAVKSPIDGLKYLRRIPESARRSRGSRPAGARASSPGFQPWAGGGHPGPGPRPR